MDDRKLFTGSLMTDAFTYPPFITLSISKEGIAIKILGETKFYFSPEDILKVKHFKSGIQFVHNNHEYPSFIFFRYDDPENISRIINSYRVFGIVQVSSEQGSELEQYKYIRIAGCFIVMSIILMGIILMILTAK